MHAPAMHAPATQVVDAEEEYARAQDQLQVLVSDMDGRYQGVCRDATTAYNTKVANLKAEFNHSVVRHTHTHTHTHTHPYTHTQCSVHAARTHPTCVLGGANALHCWHLSQHI